MRAGRRPGGRTRRSRSSSPGASRRSGGRGPCRPLDPGTKWTRSPPRSACGLPVAVVEGERLGRRVAMRPLDDVPREEDAAVRVAAAGRASSSRWRMAWPRTSMPTSARIRFASSRMRAMRSGSRTVRVGRMGGLRIRGRGRPWRRVPCPPRRFSIGVKGIRVSGSLGPRGSVRPAGPERGRGLGGLGPPPKVPVSARIGLGLSRLSKIRGPRCRTWPRRGPIERFAHHGSSEPHGEHRG